MCERKRGTGRKRRVKRAVDKAMAVSCANNARSWFQENSTTFIACGSYISLSLSRFRVASSSSIFVCPQCARLDESVPVFLSYSARYLWIVNVYFGRRQRWRCATHVSRQKEEKKKEGWGKKDGGGKKVKKKYGRWLLGAGSVRSRELWN